MEKGGRERGVYVCARNKGLAGMELGLVLVHPGHEEPEAEEKSPAGSIRPPLASLGAKRRECGDWRPLGGESVRPAGLGWASGGGGERMPCARLSEGRPGL